MSSNYKDNLQECINYLVQLTEKVAQDNSLTEDSFREETEKIASYCSAISVALQVIEYYEGRDGILKAQQGEAFLKKLDSDWYKLMVAGINEQFGIGFHKEEGD